MNKMEWKHTKTDWIAFVVIAAISGFLANLVFTGFISLYGDPTISGWLSFVCILIFMFTFGWIYEHYFK